MCMVGGGFIQSRDLVCPCRADCCIEMRTRCSAIGLGTLVMAERTMSRICERRGQFFVRGLREGLMNLRKKPRVFF